ncbi:MAG: C40 family peptidase [Pseudomonadota bacterium]
MRLILITLTFLTIFLFAARAHAAPASSGDEMDKLIADRGLLTQMDHVRQSVSNRASDLVVNAMGFLGVPYKRGGNSAETGFDCSGFVRAMYEQSIGLILPRRAEQQAAATQNIDKKDLQPGDLVFFNTMRRAFSHVGIYVGDGKFIHSPRTGSEVKVESMTVAYWTRRFDGARRVTPKTVDGVTSAAPVQLPSFAVQQMQVQTSSSILLQTQKLQQEQLYSR